MAHYDGTLIIDWPESNDDAPEGWHWGTHVSWAGGSGYYLIENGGADGAIVIARQRPDMASDDAPSGADLVARLATVEAD